jgi:glycosyltransferase involved in cell wall biosynthesis
LSTLLEAMRLLNSHGGGKYLLTTTANPAWEGAGWTTTHKADLALAQQPEVARYVEFMPSLTARQVRRLYSDACLAVFPSLCESFGHPLVEAMVHGLPIVASDTPVNHEMCGDAAIYFSPLDPEDLARQIHRVATDTALQQRMRIKAQEQVPVNFCWDAHVGKILDHLNCGT